MSRAWAAIAVAGLLVAGCSGSDGVESESTVARVDSERAAATTTGVSPNRVEVSETTVETIPEGTPVGQDLDRVAEVLLPLFEPEAAENVVSDASAVAESAGISVEKARLRLLFEAVFGDLTREVRSIEWLNAVFADSELGPLEGPIEGQIWFVGEIPLIALELVADSPIQDLVTLHGGARYTQTDVEQLTLDIAMALHDLGFAVSGGFDPDAEAFIFNISEGPDTRELTDEEIIRHLEEQLIPPLISGDVILQRSGTN